MRRFSNALFVSKVSPLGLAWVCLVLFGAGWIAKAQVDALGDMADEVADSFNQPSSIYVWTQASTDGAIHFGNAVWQPADWSMTNAAPILP